AAAVLAPAVRVADLPAAPAGRPAPAVRAFRRLQAPRIAAALVGDAGLFAGDPRHAARSDSRRVRAPGRDRARPADPEGVAAFAGRDVPGPRPVQQRGGADRRRAGEVDLP